ncbi:hypothetical protein Tco_1217566 [Tanacetum coccineum]
MISGIEDRHHVPSDAMHNLPQPFKFLSKDSCLICHGDYYTLLLSSHSEIVNIEYMAVRSSLPITKTNFTNRFHRDEGKPSSVIIKQPAVGNEEQDSTRNLVKEIWLDLEAFYRDIVRPFDELRDDFQDKYEHVGQKHKIIKKVVTPPKSDSSGRFLPPWENGSISQIVHPLRLVDTVQDVKGVIDSTEFSR